jgi:hypothetical protein
VSAHVCIRIAKFGLLKNGRVAIMFPSPSKQLGWKQLKRLTNKQRHAADLGVGFQRTATHKAATRGSAAVTSTVEVVAPGFVSRSGVL